MNWKTNHKSLYQRFRETNCQFSSTTPGLCLVHCVCPKCIERDGAQYKCQLVESGVTNTDELIAMSQSYWG